MKRRLSKLQKWILLACYDNLTEQVVKSNPTKRAKLYTMRRGAIVKGYFGEKNPASEVAVTNSIYNLVEKKYINAYTSYFWWPVLVSDNRKRTWYGRIKNISLTKQGIVKAKELLKLSNLDSKFLNNKKNSK